MNIDQRNYAIEKLQKDPRITVLLISLKAGSVGLNLNFANYVILMDLWWNPMVEEQAIDRVHRIGQKNEVNIFRITVENTIEDRILNLQERKVI
jgi:SNF2 family DNA or RNA helicase